MSDEQLEQIAVSIEQANKAIKLMDALSKLTKNKDFNTIINTGYFIDEASRAVLIKAEPGMQDEESIKQIDNQITGIGYLRQYFITIMQLGRAAERAKANDEQTQEELLKEELESDGGV